MTQYLRQHPEVFMPDAKELHFFGSDLAFRRHRPDQGEFLSFFSPPSYEKRIGEASVWYLYSRNAASEIKKFEPEARIIIMLRDPVDMLYSLHSQFLYNGNEDITDFKKAIDAEPDRKRGLRIPKTVIHAGGLLYRETARFSDQVGRYFDVFGRDRVHIIIYDDFRAAPSEEYGKTCAFLGIDPNFTPEFKIVNPNKQARSSIVRGILREPPVWASRIARIVPQAQRAGIKQAMKRFNTRYTPRLPIDPDLKKTLRREFAPEVEKLGILIGRDLSHWSKE